MILYDIILWYHVMISYHDIILFYYVYIKTQLIITLTISYQFQTPIPRIDPELYCSSRGRVLKYFRLKTFFPQCYIKKVPFAGTNENTEYVHDLLIFNGIVNNWQCCINNNSGFKTSCLDEATSWLSWLEHKRRRL